MKIPPWLFCPSCGSWQKENVPCLSEVGCTGSWARHFIWNMIPIIKNSKKQDSLLKLIKILPKFQKTTTTVPVGSLLSLSQSAGTVIWRCSCATVDMNQMKTLLLKCIPNSTSQLYKILLSYDLLKQRDAFIKIAPWTNKDLKSSSVSAGKI